MKGWEGGVGCTICPLEFDSSFLTFDLSFSGLLQRLVVGTRLLNATAQLLRGQLQTPGRLVQQDPKRRIRFLASKKKIKLNLI